MKNNSNSTILVIFSVVLLVVGINGDTSSSLINKIPISILEDSNYDTYASSSNYNGSSLEISKCQQWDPSYYTTLYAPGFEEYLWYNGYYIIQLLYYVQKGPDSITPQEGYSFALFSRKYSQMYSMGVRFPDLKNETISKALTKVEFNIYIKFVCVSSIPSNSGDSSSSSSSSSSSDSGSATYSSSNSGSGSIGGGNYIPSEKERKQKEKEKERDSFNHQSNNDPDYDKYSSSYIENQQYVYRGFTVMPKVNIGEDADYNNQYYLNILLNGTVIQTISFDQYNQTNYEYQLFTFDISDYAVNGSYNLTLAYYYPPPLLGYDVILIADNIFFNTPVPELIHNDVYVDSNGNDFTGDGTISNAFCSIQRALMAVADGYTVYVNNDLNVVAPDPSWPYYINTSPRNNITIAGYGVGTQYVLDPFNTTSGDYGAIILCHSAICNFSNLHIYIKYRSNILSVASWSNVMVDNIFFDGTSEGYQQENIMVGYMSNITITDSVFIQCDMNCIRSVGWHNTIKDSIFTNCTGALYITVASYNGITVLDNLVLTSHVDIISSMTYYDSILMNNLVYSNGFFGVTQDLYYGNSFTWTNSLIYNCSINFDLLRTKTIYIQNITIEAMSVNTTGVFVITYPESVTILDSSFTNSFNYYVPFFVITNGDKFIMNNISVLNNLNMFVLFNTVNNISISNTKFVGNKNEFQIQTEWSNIVIDQINYLNNSNSFLLSYSSNLSISDSLFNNNFNNLTNPIPLISIQKPYSINVTNSMFSNNFNFHIFKIFKSLNSRASDDSSSDDGGDSSSTSTSVQSSSSSSSSQSSSGFNINPSDTSGGSEYTLYSERSHIDDDDNTLGVILSNLTFYNNIIGDLINLNSVIATIKDIKVSDNFLGTFYPINSYNSNFTVSHSTFNSTTHYFFIENSRYSFDFVIWNSTLCINDKSLYIYESVGGFRNSSLQGTSPNYGFVVKNSQVNYEATEFSGLSSFYYPLGSYENSSVTFDNCTFYNNSAGEQMMTFSKGAVSFKYCTFTKLGSPGVNIMEASKMNLVLFDHCFISCNGENNGMKIVESDITLINNTLTENEYPYGSFMEIYSSNITLFQTYLTNNNDIAFKIEESYAFLEGVAIANNHFSQTCLFTVQDSIFLVYNSHVSGNSLIQNTALFSLSRSQALMSEVSFSSNNLQDTALVMFLFDESHINVTQNTKFQGNTSPNGLFTLYKGSHANIIDSSFMSNTSPGSSIALVYEAGMYILNSSFVENISKKDGGVMNVVNSSIIIQESNFQKNVANTDGGIFYSDDNSYISFGTCNLLNNEATYGAGGLCYSPSKPVCYIDSMSVQESNKAVYGNNLATGPHQLSISFSNSLHVNTTVTLSVSLTDFYNQTISILPNPSSFSLEVYLLPTDQLILYETLNRTMQGMVSLPVTFRDPMFSEYRVKATQIDSNGVSLETNNTFKLLPCNPGYYPGGNDSSCIQCAPGFFGTDGYNCMECDTEKIQCPGLNITIANEGYWIYNQSSEFLIFECDPNICLVGECRSNQTGFLCAHCDPGFQKVKQICTSCTSFNVLLLLGIIAFFILYALTMTIFKIPSSTIMFNFILAVQIICIFSHNIQYFVISPLMGFDIDYWPKTCLGPNLNYFWKKVISLGIMYVFVLPVSVFFNWGQSLVLLVFSKWKSFLQETFGDRQWKETLISQLMMMYGPITYVSLSLVSCTKYANNYYLNQDASIQCYTSSHLPVFIVSILSIVFVTVGVPFYLFLQIKLKKRYFIKMFFDKYKAKYVWWDIVLLLRTSIFIAVTIATTFHIDAKGLVVSSIGFVFTLLNWIIKPYRSPSRNELDTHLGLIICFGGIIINSRAFSFSENQDLFNIVPGIVLSCSTVLLIVPVILCIRALVSPKVQFKHSYSSTGSTNYEDQPLLYHFLSPESNN